MLNTMSKIRGQVKSPGYPQSEGLLGECMIRYGKELGDDSNFGECPVGPASPPGSVRMRWPRPLPNFQAVSLNSGRVFVTFCITQRYWGLLKVPRHRCPGSQSLALCAKPPLRSFLLNTEIKLHVGKECFLASKRNNRAVETRWSEMRSFTVQFPARALPQRGCSP